MNLRQLEAFRATMQSGSITGAAEMLHISQPSVSRLIADLERSVGFALFLRTGRGLSATVEARRFFQAVESMFIGTDRLEELARTIRTTASGTVTLGVIPSMTAIAAPQAISTFLGRRDDTRIMVYERNTPGILDAVQMQQFDLGIVGRQPPYDGVETLFLTEIPYVCVMPENHPGAGEAGPVDLAELAGDNSFITFGGTFPDEMMGLDPALSARLRGGSRLSAANMPISAALVRETGSLAIVDPFSAELAVRLGGVVFRPLLSPLVYHVAVITRGRDTLSREAGDLASIFVDLLTARGEEVRAYARRR